MDLSVLITDFNSLTEHRSLVDGMLTDRRRQFVDRQAWHIPVLGEYELDQFDHRDFNPLYVIVGTKDPYGQIVHIGSARIMPTTGRTMLNEVFHDMIEAPIHDPEIWEVTRMVVSPQASPELQASAVPLVLYAGNEVFRSMGVSKCVAAFSKKMLPIYKRLGNPPNVIGQGQMGGDEVLIGEFPCDQGLSERLMTRIENPDKVRDMVASAIQRFHDYQAAKNA